MNPIENEIKNKEKEIAKLERDKNIKEKLYPKVYIFLVKIWKIKS